MRLDGFLLECSFPKLHLGRVFANWNGLRGGNGTWKKSQQQIKMGWDVFVGGDEERIS